MAVNQLEPDLELRNKEKEQIKNILKQMNPQLNQDYEVSRSQLDESGQGQFDGQIPKYEQTSINGLSKSLIPGDDTRKFGEKMKGITKSGGRARNKEDKACCKNESCCIM